MDNGWDTMEEPHSTTILPNCVTVEIEDAAQAMWTPEAVYAELALQARDLERFGPLMGIRIRADVGLDYASSFVLPHYVPADCYLTDPALCQLTFRITLLTRQFDPARAATYRGVLAHEYGHAWSRYYMVLHHGFTWADYQVFRGLPSPDPTTMTSEIFAEDYRMCFGTEDAKNSYVFYGYPHTRDVPGLCSWLDTTWEV
jgi:hypothetical protein